MINYRFQVSNIEIAPTGSAGYYDVVTRVFYNYIGEDNNGNSGSFFGIMNIPTPVSGSDDNNEFINFKDLQEEDIAGWLSALIGNNEYMQEEIQKQIRNQISPQNVPVPLPWINQE